MKNKKNEKIIESKLVAINNLKSLILNLDCSLKRCSNKSCSLVMVIIMQTLCL